MYRMNEIDEINKTERYNKLHTLSDWQKLYIRPLTNDTERNVQLPFAGIVDIDTRSSVSQYKPTAFQRSAYRSNRLFIQDTIEGFNDDQPMLLVLIGILILQLI